MVFHVSFITPLARNRYTLTSKFSKFFLRGELSSSQKQGVVHLIPKKDKDITDLKSWRPLTIFNTDYKIIAEQKTKNCVKRDYTS